VTVVTSSELTPERLALHLAVVQHRQGDILLLLVVSLCRRQHVSIVAVTVRQLPMVAGSRARRDDDGALRPDAFPARGAAELLPTAAHRGHAG